MFKKIITITLSLFIQVSIFAEGLGPTTKVHTNYGLFEMQELQKGMQTLCKTDTGEVVFSEITGIEKIETPVLYTFNVNEKNYEATGSQLFYSTNRNAWVKLCELDTEKDVIVVNFNEDGKINDLKELLPRGYMYNINAKSFEEYSILIPCPETQPNTPQEKRFVYKISVKDHHTFFVGEGILCHDNTMTPPSETMKVLKNMAIATTTIVLSSLLFAL